MRLALLRISVKSVNVRFFKSVLKPQTLTNLLKNDKKVANMCSCIYDLTVQL